MLKFKKYGLFFLILTQFSVVLVDNIFKLIIAFFLIDISGKEAAGQILSVVGAVYVIPFLLLSSFGGSLADRFSKRSITIFIKCIGGIIILTSFYVFYIKSAKGCYLLLFLLSTQSALFGPSKYGMIPELVPHHEISKANGYITSFTYLAIILGTFLGSFLSQLFHKNYFAVLGITFIFSAIGIIASFLIPKTHKIAHAEHVPVSVFKETFKVISRYPKKAHLGIAMLACSFFLLSGSFTQMAIIPYAISVLKQSEFVGGYLFLTTALGIALGSQIVGKLSKTGPNLIFPAFGGIILGLMLVALGLFVNTIKGSIISLVILGLAGGFYIVPLEAFLQTSSLPEHRGRILGLNNLLGFTGVLVASGLLYLFSSVFHLSPDKSFMILGISTLFMMYYIIRKISDLLLALWLNSKFLKKSHLAIIPSDISVLLVSKANFQQLRRISTNKTRIRIITDSRSPFMPSCLLLKKKNQSSLHVINQEIDKDELVIVEKKFVDFELDQVDGKVADIETKQKEQT